MAHAGGRGSDGRAPSTTRSGPVAASPSRPSSQAAKAGLAGRRRARSAVEVGRARRAVARQPTAGVVEVGAGAGRPRRSWPGRRSAAWRSRPGAAGSKPLGPSSTANSRSPGKAAPARQIALATFCGVKPLIGCRKSAAMWPVMARSCHGLRRAAAEVIQDGPPWANPDGGGQTARQRRRCQGSRSRHRPAGSAVAGLAGSRLLARRPAARRAEASGPSLSPKPSTPRARPRPDGERSLADPAPGLEGHRLAHLPRNGRARLPALAGGVTFYLLLATFPAIAAFVSLYGLFSDVDTVEHQFLQLAGGVPAATRSTSSAIR